MILKKTKLSPQKSKDVYQNHHFCSTYRMEKLFKKYFKIDDNEDVFVPFIYDSILHLTLNKVFEKQNCMVEGKYKKARLYLLETDNLYLAAICETGERGSAIYFTTKKEGNLNKLNAGNHLLNLELTEALLDYCYLIIKNNEKYKNELKLHRPELFQKMTTKYSVEEELELLNNEMPTPKQDRQIKIKL